MRTMSVEKLLKGMPTLQSQIDALLDFEVSDVPRPSARGTMSPCNVTGVLSETVGMKRRSAEVCFYYSVHHLATFSHMKLLVLFVVEGESYYNQLLLLQYY